VKEKAVGIRQVGSEPKQRFTPPSRGEGSGVGGLQRSLADPPPGLAALDHPPHQGEGKER
jgi:hypothetical protein